MTFTIPEANGLAQELLERTRGRKLSVSEPREQLAANKLNKITTIDVLVDEEPIGRVEINSYETNGVRCIASVGYVGRMPGYVNTATGRDEILLTATEFPDEYVNVLSRIPTQTPNNTSDNPLYRIDRHQTLRLANHELNGRAKEKNKLSPLVNKYPNLDNWDSPIKTKVRRFR